MKNSGNNLRVARLVLMFALMSALLLLNICSAAQSVTMPRMREMAGMQDHHSHPSERKTAPKSASDQPESAFTFVTIDVPGGAGGTLATGINASGYIVGIYYDAEGNSHGFLLQRGEFSTVDVPGSLVGVSGMLQTEANGINNAGDIVGDYYAPPGAPGAPACSADSPAFSPQCRRGFLLHDGQFSNVLVPGKKGSIPNAISPDGSIYGCDHDDDYFASMVGFGRLNLHTYITLDASGGELANPKVSVVGSMNNGATPDGSTIIGLYVDPANSTGQYHGYVVHEGRFHRYDVAGSVNTQIWGINPDADFVGLYDDAIGNEHGFLQHWGTSAPITIDVPNATLTDAFAINCGGTIVGLYIDANGAYHGYVAHPRREE